ncbi:MAG: helix-turn-helix domain-containing protein [Candidatus Thiodiazotropha sp. (ex Epidulcina cf. delphinae)]|nr:helix-turn-helix domain-containing protein [Candidatus Thiodiazotropha sp. (ex Epidulcina cf. delphinae)]
MPDMKSLPSPENPDEALAAVVALRVMADRLERKSVEKAIEQGWTWAQVAEALGVTRQAAHKRHAAFINTKKVSKKRG